MNNKELKKKKIRRASLRERFYFLLTGRIPNYAMRANNDVSWAWLNILHDPKSEIKYFRNMPDNEKKIIKNFLCTNRISNRKEQVEAFEKEFNILTWDAPGHASSRPFRLDFSLMDKAVWLHGILENE